MFENQTEEDAAIVNADDAGASGYAPSRPRVFWFSRQRRVAEVGVSFATMKLYSGATVRKPCCCGPGTSGFAEITTLKMYWLLRQPQVW